MRTLILALATLTVSGTAMADKRKKSKEPSAETSGDESSGSPRAGKVAWVGVEPIGFTLFPTRAIRGGWIVNPELAIEGSYAFVNGSSSGTLDMSKSLLEVKGKYFFGNSFYVDGGVAYETWEIKSDYQVASGPTLLE